MGKKAFYDGHIEDAIGHFNRVLEDDALDPLALVYRGNCLLIIQDFEGAEHDFSKAIEAYYRNRRRSVAGGYEIGEMTLMQLGVAEEARPALIYNNRGIARYYLGDRKDAIEDFESALEIEPSLEIARRNRLTAGKGDPPSLMAGKDGRNSYMRKSANAHIRPISPRPDYPKDPEVIKEETQNLRKLREVSIVDEGVSRGSIFGPRPRKAFTGRTIPKKGKFYREPPVKRKSQSYIYIDNVKITETSTFIRFKVDNPEGKDFQVSLGGKGTPEAYFITDRTGSAKSRYKLRKIVDGLEAYPKATTLKPGMPLYFTLEFEKIPNNLGYINIIEGNRQDGQSWNFYEVDLTGQR